MRVYVAGKFEEKARVRETQEILKARGHEITYDWTVNEDATAHKPTCAFNDLVGVLRADAFVLHWHPNLKGGNVELGAALALERIAVYVIGCPVNDQPNVFYHHAAIKHCLTLDEVLAHGVL